MNETIKFEPVEGARPTRVAHGEYARELDGNPPYEATPEEWEKYLKPTGLFREIVHRQVGVGDGGKGKDK